VEISAWSGVHGILQSVDKVSSRQIHWDDDIAIDNLFDCDDRFAFLLYQMVWLRISGGVQIQIYGGRRWLGL